MTDIKYIVSSNMFRFWLNHLQGASGTSKKPTSTLTTHRFEHNLKYNSDDGFWKYRMLPEDGLIKNETCWRLTMYFILVINFNF